VGIFLLAYGWVMLQAGNALRLIERQVETDGVDGEGVVTAHRSSTRKRAATIYFITYQCTVRKPDGTSQDLTKESAVSYADYDHYFPGEKVLVRYLQDQPGVVLLGGGIREIYTATKMRLNGILMLCVGFVPLLLAVMLVYNQVRYNALPGTPPQGRLLVPILVDNGQGRGVTQIFRFDVDGSSRSNLTVTQANESDPAWSPDGKQIAFVSNRDNQDQLYLMNTDGSNPKNISPNPNQSDRLPLWSPDGQHILFESYFSAGSKWDIWVMNADGTNPKNLSGDHILDNGRMSWSPDSKHFAFSGSTEAGDAIRVMDIDGSQAAALTPKNSQDFDPIWSPDGKQIAFIRGTRGSQDIWLMNTDGSDARQLTFDQKWIAQLAWSSDGHMLGFISSGAGYYELYIMQSDGTDLHKAAPAKAADMNFVWSPDAKQMLVISNITSGRMGVLMLVDVEAKTRTTIVDDVYTSGLPAWMPNLSIPTSSQS